MELVDVLRKRTSIRKFKDKPVPDKTVKAIVNLAKLAPSAGNLQAYKILLVKDADLYQVKAPLSMVICADNERSGSRYGDKGKNLFALQDATIFASYVQLVAVEFGLSTLWVGSFSRRLLREMFNIPEDLTPVAIMLIGYADIDKPGMGNRREFEDILL